LLLTPLVVSEPSLSSESDFIPQSFERFENFLFDIDFHRNRKELAEMCPQPDEVFIRIESSKLCNVCPFPSASIMFVAANSQTDPLINCDGDSIKVALPANAQPLPKLELTTAVSVSSVTSVAISPKGIPHVCFVLSLLV
jgi:hypothetical protein